MRGEMYNEGGFYRMVPLHRFAVVPGETVSLSAAVRMISAAFEKPIITGGQFIVAAFYTPYRLLWDGWIDFVTQGDFSSTSQIALGGQMTTSAAAIPTSQVAWPLIFEGGAQSLRPVSIFGRRAYKLIMNEYFGDAAVPRSRYANIEDDADVSQKPTRNIDQFLSKLVMSGDVESPGYSVPVSNNAVVMNLDALRAALVRQKSMKRRDMTGDKYVDALMRMGVKLDWRVQNAPECLGVWKTDLESSLTKATSTDAVGKMVGQFKAFTQVQSGKKFFAEHGLVMLVAIAKPTVFFPGQSAPDALIYSKNMVFMGDNQVGSEYHTLEDLQPGQGNILGRNFEYLSAGRSIAGQMNAQSWVPQLAFDATPNFDDMLYPVGISDALLPQLGFGGLAFRTEFAHKMVLPFNRNII